MSELGHDEHGEVAEKPSGALLARVDFGGSTLAKYETHTEALAAAAKAEIEARHLVALRFPRNEDEARIAMLRACRRPLFAQKARYHKPQGQKKNEDTGQWEPNILEGPSIRFIEELIRDMGHIGMRTAVVHDDDRKRIVRVTVTDYQRNTPAEADVLVEKTVERRTLKKGQKPVSSRLNSYGDVVFLLVATDDEVRMKEAALVSKAVRTLGLRLLPADLVEEGQEVCIETARAEDKRDPDAAKKKVIDGFAKEGIKPVQLVEYLGRSLDEISIEVLEELRGVYLVLVDKDLTWDEIVEGSPHRKGDAAAEGKAQSKLVKTLEEKKEERRKAKQAAAGEKPVEQPAASSSPAAPAEPPKVAPTETKPPDPDKETAAPPPDASKPPPPEPKPGRKPPATPPGQARQPPIDPNDDPENFDRS